MERMDKENAKWLMCEAIRLTREKPVNSTWTERTFLLDEAWQTVADLPQPLQQGKGLYEVLSRASVPIDGHDLLLGRYVDKVPDEAEEARFWSIVESGRDRHNPITSRNVGHITLDFPGACRLGLPGYIEKTERRLARARADGEDANALLQLEGMLWVYRALLLYVGRYADAAKAAGMNESAAVCRALTAGPAGTFREALQLMVLIFNVYLVYAGTRVACLTFGRVDDDLLPYYEADIAAGRLTREQAGYLIDDFYTKCSLHLGRGEHQMANPAFGGNTTGWERNIAFDSPTYIVLGGYSNVRDHRQNPLTRLFVERIEPKLKNPVVIFRRTNDTDPALWRLLCDKVRQNASVLLYNDETVIPAYRTIGVEERDAVNYSVHPCNWADIAGGYAVVGGVGGLLPKMLLQVLNERTDFDSIDEIYAALAQVYRATVRQTFADYRRIYRQGKIPSNGLISLTDCFLEGTIENARGQFDGGVKYPAIYAQIRNVGTATDMMAAIDTLVFRKKICTLSELMAACAADFEGYPDLWNACRRAPKYGRDDDAADAHAVRLLRTVLDVLDEESFNEKGERDVLTLNTTITDTWHIGEGAQLQATPDGRRRGAPLSENLAPTPGCAESVTALLNTIAKLPGERLHSGACNVRLRRDAVAGEAGLARLAVLLDTYFENGGMQAQISVADTAQLREAQKCPENYRDLTVRITGYSAVFVDMSANAQEEIIRRDEMA